MGYGRRAGRASPLPGSSIKGAGSLAPGVYRCFYEKRRLPGGGIQQVFVTMPHGLHVADEYIALLDEGEDYDVTVALSEGCMLMRTDGGRYVMADAATKDWQTEAYTDVMSCIAEAAEKKLKLTSPVIARVERAGELIYVREQRNSADESVCVAEASASGTEPGS